MSDTCPECLGTGVWRECWESDGKNCSDLLWCEIYWECPKCGKRAWGAEPKEAPKPPPKEDRYEPVPKSKNKKSKRRKR